MKMYKNHAKPISYDSKNKRNRKDVLYIVIHYTGNKSDTAKGNVDYFATNNDRQAGAHFFVDADGNIAKSIDMNRTAWSVGGLYSVNNGAGNYYGECTNANSVSIELCDCCVTYTEKQAKAVTDLIKYIRKYCKNAKTVIRHWDVNGKECPAPMKGKNNKLWKKFLKEIGEV